MLYGLEHPNIVSYFEHFTFEHFYIAMEFCDGGDLSKKIKEQNGKWFKEEEVLKMFQMLAKAVAFLHGQTQPILHRDIKPVNIFLLKDGTLKLGDLGIGRVLNNSEEFAETMWLSLLHVT